MARRRPSRGTEEEDDFTYVDGGRIRRIRFEGTDNDDLPEFQSMRAPDPEEPVLRESAGREEVIRVRDYRPRHVAPIGDIEFEVDHLNEIRAGHIPRGTPPGRTDLMRTRKPREETVYETERGRVTRTVGPSGPALYVERGSALSSERFRSSLVDVIVKDVDLDEEVVIRRKIVEETPTTSTTTTTTKRVTKKRGTKKKSAAKAAPAKKPAKRAKKVAASAQRAQVAVGDYKLFHTGNRYFFSKKSQAESAKGGAHPVYEVPADRKVVETPNGLPVLKAVGAKKPAAKKSATKKSATRKPAATKSAAATSAVSKPAAKKAPVKRAAAKEPVAAKPAAKKAPVKKASAKRATAKKPAAKKAPVKKASAKRAAPKKAVATKPAAKAVAAKKKSDSQPQCAGLTADGKQCRNSARGVSKYCASHKGYQPRTLASTKALDTVPAAKQAKDTKPTKAAASKAGAPQAQCAGLTADGKQCRNSSRGSSKYCASHKGYRPAKGLAALDTKPRAKKAADTKPSIRKG